MDPFDWRSVVLAKHAQHVVLIHFPIALFIIGVVFDVWAQRLRRRELAEAAYYNLFAAAMFVVPTVLSGVVAWRWLLEGQKLKGILLYHLLLGWASAGVILSSWWLHFRARRNAQATPCWRIVLECAGVLLLMITGHLGGFLSGVNGTP